MDLREFWLDLRGSGWSMFAQLLVDHSRLWIVLFSLFSVPKATVAGQCFRFYKQLPQLIVLSLDAAPWKTVVKRAGQWMQQEDGLRSAEVMKQNFL